MENWKRPLTQNLFPPDEDNIMNWFANEILPLWQQGGWLMIPLGLIAVFIYFSILELHLYFRNLTFCRTPKDRLREWVMQPLKADDEELSSILKFTQSDREKPSDVQKAFEEVRNSFLPLADRRLHFLNILVGTAPLMGLLGTVAGMLTTFKGLSVSAGGDTIDFVAGGISEALITTETGLVIAIPAYILLGRTKQLRNQLELFLTQLESLTLQKFKKRNSKHLTTA